MVNDFLVRLSIRSAMFAGAITGFVFGLFVNDLPIPCNDHPPNQPAACSKLTAADSSFSNTFPELARPAVREALKSW